MKEFTNELIDGIVEVSLETGVSTRECIKTAIKMLELEKQFENMKNISENAGRKLSIDERWEIDDEIYRGISNV